MELRTCHCITGFSDVLLEFLSFRRRSPRVHRLTSICVFGVQLAAGLGLQEEFWPQQPSPRWALAFRESWLTPPPRRREARSLGARAAAERPVRPGCQWVRLSRQTWGLVFLLYLRPRQHWGPRWGLLSLKKTASRSRRIEIQV